MDVAATRGGIETHSPNLCCNLLELPPTSMEYEEARSFRHYTHAPIQEAIIDIRIDPSASRSLDDLECLHQQMKGTYPERRDLIVGLLSGTLEAGQLTATSKQDTTGFIFTNLEKTKVVQCRLNGFSFSQLAPYETWDRFRDEARKNWILYRTAMGSTPVIHVALRYINQINIPIPFRDFSDYIRTYPEVSTDLPQELSGYFMQLSIPQKDIEAMLVLNQVLVPPPKSEVASVILDIDIIRNGLKLKSDEEVWNVLEILRARKNSVFEACITNATRELIR